MRTRPARMQPPSGVVVAAIVVALIALIPIVTFLATSALTAGSGILPLIFRPLTGTYLWNTVLLTVIVCPLCGVVGCATAWIVERTAIPFRALLTVLLILPLGIPDFVVAYGWYSVAPWVSGLGGATLVMTLGLYPLVYLPVAARLRSLPMGHDEVSRSLGVGPLRSFVSVTLPAIRTALLGGLLLVAFAVLAEYGAFEVLRYNTLTTEIYTEYSLAFDAPVSAALSLVLLVLALVITTVEGRLRRGDIRQLHAVNRGARPISRKWGQAGRTAICGVVIALGVGEPLVVVVGWMIHGGATTLPQSVSMVSALTRTVVYGLAAGVIATAAALPVVTWAHRYRSRNGRHVERAVFLLQAMPGIIIALALAVGAIHVVPALYQTDPLIIAAYVFLFLPLAVVGVRGSVAAVPMRFEEVAASLGSSRWEVARRVVFPLIGPGLAASCALVFLGTVTELTTTLILIPTGAQTLATEFWAQEQQLAYGAAAPYALLMIAISALPTVFLANWFSHRAGPARSA